MTRRHLTAAGISRIKPPAKGQVDHFDAGYPGLALRVSYGGSRSWVYFYRWQGKQKRLTLGPWPALGAGASTRGVARSTQEAGGRPGADCGARRRRRR